MSDIDPVSTHLTVHMVNDHSASRNVGIKQLLFPVFDEEIFIRGSRVQSVKTVFIQFSVVKRDGSGSG